MGSKLRFWLTGALVLIAAMLFFVLFGHANNQINLKEKKQTEMLDMALRWGRLANLPQSAENFHIYEEYGVLFANSLKVEFSASAEDIKRWIKSSPGLSSATVELSTNGNHKYIISPAGGVGYAMAVINSETNEVQISVYWE